MMRMYPDKPHDPAAHHGRAKLIEQIVQKDYADDETDAADLALDELARDDSRSDRDIAHDVAMRISFP